MDTFQRNDYWDGFYSHGTAFDLSIPSQFAAFVANECRIAGTVVDIACGNGRDSMFFAQHFEQVIGVDRSATAIVHCRSLAETYDMTNAEFFNASVTDPNFTVDIASWLSTADKQPAVVYARFFLHAITEAEEGIFFDALASAMRKGDILALEYRTLRDASNAKSTPSHFRRFVSPETVLSSLSARQFRLDYAVEGLGMAKYRHDDAYIPRSVHKKE